MFIRPVFCNSLGIEASWVPHKPGSCSLFCILDTIPFILSLLGPHYHGASLVSTTELVLNLLNQDPKSMTVMVHQPLPQRHLLTPPLTDLS